MQDTGMKKVLGIKECIMIGIGGMMGSSIFTLSGVTFGLAGSAAIISWVLGGIIVMLYGLNVGELASRFPSAGGLYVYPSETLGSTEEVKTFMGWIAAWSWLNVMVLGTAFGAIFIANYLAAIVPAAMNHVILVGIISIILCFALNYFGIALMGRSTIILTSLLLASTAIFVIMGLPNVSAANFQNFFSQGILGGSGVITSIPMAMLAYGSVIALASLGEEARDPERTIPRAIVFAMLITMSAYVIILFTTFGTAPWQAFTPDSPSLYAPLHFAAGQFAGDRAWVSVLISIAALFAILTTMLVQVMSAGRTFMGTAGNVLPNIFKSLSPYKTPGFAMGLTCVAAAVIACFPQFVYQIIGTGALCMSIMVILVVLSLISARLNRKDTTPSFTVPGGLIIPVITIAVVAFNLSRIGGDAFMLGGWWYLIGIIIFFVCRPIAKKQKAIEAKESI